MPTPGTGVVSAAGRRTWLVLALTALLGAGCAAPSTQPSTPLAAPTLPTTLPHADNGVVLPTPPPPGPDDLAPERDGVAALEPATAAQPAIAGYTGQHWAEVATGDVAVMDGSVTVLDGVVRGLVRNDTARAVGPVTITLGESSTSAPVPVLRPGEPAPFVLDTAPPSSSPSPSPSVPASPGPSAGSPSSTSPAPLPTPSAVPSATKADDLALVVDAPEATRAPSRMLRLATFWERGVDDPQPVDTYLYTDPEGARPAVAFGEVLAAEAVEDLVVVAAWLDEDGRVLAVDPAAELQSTTLGPGAASDFLVASEGSSALADAQLVLWASGP